MSKRLQVILSESEMSEIKEAARSSKLTVGEWVRRLLRRGCQERAGKTAEQKIRAIRKAAKLSFPTADIEQMNREIESGYSNGLS